MTSQQPKRRRARNQKGSIYKASGAFYVRYYTRDADGRPVQTSAELCRITKHNKNKYTSVACAAVKNERDKYMAKINSDTRPAQPVLVTDYWCDPYLAYLKENLRASTVKGYEQLWESALKPHFTGKILQEYQIHHRNEFLLSMMNKKKPNGTKKYGLRTLNHIRWLASGIFGHAQDVKGLISMNPWRGDLKIFDKVETPGPRPHYTLQESLDVIKALDGRLDCQLVMAIACFAGLRQSEIRGLRWEDFSGDQVHVRRAFVRESEVPVKSKTSNRPVPIIPPLAVMLEAWRQKSGSPTQGWVFPNQTGSRPINLRDRARNIIKPMLKKANCEWKGYHAGRHGLGTMLTGLTGTALAAKEALGHSTQAVTETFYLHRTDNTLPSAFKQLAGAVEAKEAEAHR